MLTRRSFLKSSSLVALGAGVPGFLSRTAAHTQPAGQPGARDNILVVIQLTGGNDGLNTVIPFSDPEYARLRPTLRQPANQVVRVNDRIGLHPSMTGLGGLLEDRSLCIVQGVGYPNPSQSHFASMDYWQAGRIERSPTEGWVGKAVRHMPGVTGCYHMASANESAPAALAGAPVRAPSITSLDDFQLRLEASSAANRREQQRLLDAVATPAANPGPHQPEAQARGQADLLDFVQRTAANTFETTRRLRDIGRNYQPSVTYPATKLANHLKLAAQLINANLGARLFYVTIDGFDTHSGQAPLHANLWREVSDAMTAFYRDLAARGQRDRVLLMTFSEFGRRARENGSRGTDHGSAAPMLLVGGRVKPGLVGDHPSLTQLEDGNLRHHTDFRQVYAAILDNWLGVPSRQVLGQAFQPVDIFQR